MKLRAICRLVGLILAVECLLTAQSQNRAFPQSRQFGRTIASLTVGRDDLTRARSLYGPGAEATLDDVQSLCYYVEQDDSYLSISTYERRPQIRSISLTKFPDLATGCRSAKITGKHLTATAGVALGDRMPAVLAALGTPGDTYQLQLGKHSVVQADYRVVGGKATCMFEQSKLVLIAIELE